MSSIIGNYVGGSYQKLQGGTLENVFNPSTGEISAQVRFTSKSELDDVVNVASAALPSWSSTAPSKRSHSRSLCSTDEDAVLLIKPTSKIGLLLLSKRHRPECIYQIHN